jgi:hypothetical protein
MLFSPEIDAMKEQMTAIIVRDSEDFFDNPKESADSGRCRSAFRAHADHSFRAMSISDSGGCRSLIPE